MNIENAPSPKGGVRRTTQTPLVEELARYELMYIDTLGRPSYRCIDCYDIEHDGVVLDVHEHDVWHLSGGGCEDDQNGVVDVDSDGEVAALRRPEVALSGADSGWAARFDQAAAQLDSAETSLPELVNLGQKFVPCSLRRTHRSLAECGQCAHDYLLGHASLDELLVAAARRLRPDGWGK